MRAGANTEIAASDRFLDRTGRTLQVIDRDGDDVLYAIRGVATFGALRASLPAFRTMVGLDRAAGIHLAWSRGARTN